MSSAGIHGELRREGRPAIAVNVIGWGVPRIHHSDGIPVYQVAKDSRGLYAYPAEAAGPGPTHWADLHASHELLCWQSPVPVY